MGSDQVRHKADCAVTEAYQKLENFGFKKNRKCTIRVAKTKALISFAVTCVVVFAYADCWFSHKAAKLYLFQAAFGDHGTELAPF